MRLDKFLGNNSEYTRSDARKLVKSKRVTINGEPATDVGAKINPEKDLIRVDDVHIEEVGFVYFMLHKPLGFVSANNDGMHPTVIDLLKKQKNFIGDAKAFSQIPYSDLQIVGRLDIDTTGLLLITNNGDWNHSITSPNAACQKTYRVSLEKKFDVETLSAFTKGMALEGEKKRTRPARVELITPKKIRLTISEGKFHQVKRMFIATGNKVKKLHRESIGQINLDNSLEPGEFRALTTEEVQSATATRSKFPS